MAVPESAIHTLLNTASMNFLLFANISDRHIFCGRIYVCDARICKGNK